MMTDPLPSLGQMFPLDLIFGAVAVFAAMFIIPSLWWIYSEHRDNRRFRR
jgi:hypothetical protein